MIKWFAILLLLLTTGCSSPASRLPDLVTQAQLLDKDARRALFAGDLNRAAYNFNKVLLLQQSIDDLPAVGVTLINLATVAYQQQNDAVALGWLNKIVQENPRLYPVDVRLLAQFRKSVILANQHQLDEAESALQSAQQLCENKCASALGIAVLNARLQLLKGDANGSLALSQRLINQAETNQEELANILRVMAAAEERLQRYAEAMTHFEKALNIDKTLALSNRIAEDLQGIARNAKNLGQDEAAATYEKRAQLILQSRTKGIPATR